MQMVNDVDQQKQIAELTSGVALQSLIVAQQSGGLGSMDIDRACKLARDASIDPKGGFRVLDDKFNNPDVPPEEVYNGIMDSVLTDRYDKAVFGSVNRTTNEQASREAGRIQAMAAASSSSPEDFKKVLDMVDEGDDSPFLLAAERLYYN